MTVQTTMPVPVDDLLDEARRMARQEGAIPSKDRLMRAFRIGRPKACQIHDRLHGERTERRRQARTNLRRVATRKGPPRPLPVRFLPLPEPFPAPDVQPAPGRVFPQATPTVEGVEAAAAVPLPEPSPPATAVARRKVLTWPALIVAAPAFVAIWAGWVALGKLTGFGKINLLPGVWQGWVVDTAITLPIGVEAYAAYAFYVWLHPSSPARARRFAAWSSLGAVLLGMAGQTAYHLMAAAGMTAAPWEITTVVSCLPVAVFGLAAALIHLVRAGETPSSREDTP